MPRRIRRPVVAMNIRTREVIRFDSVADCGRYFRIGVCNMNPILKHSQKFVPRMGHYLKYEDDETPWPDKNYVYEKPIRVEIPVVITHIDTGKIEKYPNMASAGKRLGCNCSTISYQIQKEDPVPYRGYYIRRAPPQKNESRP